MAVVAVVGLSAPASAVPPHARAIEAPAVLRAARTARALARTSVLPFVFAPLRYAPRAARESPIQSLPLGARPAAVRLLPVLLAVPALPEGADRCGERRSATLLTTLNAPPFTPVACLRAAPPADRLPTSLVPGGKKRALYGPAYAPRDFEDL
jgi:hypothetical protein